MKPEKVNIILPEGYDGKPVELVFREGQAEEIKDHFTRLKLRVAMSSMFAFVVGNRFKDAPQDNTGVLTYNFDERRVEFNTDPTNARSIVLSSNLTVHPDLSAFGINEDHLFSSRALIKHVTKYAHCFATLDAPRKLIQSLQNHEVKFEQEMKNLDDRAGNTERSVKTALKVTEGMIDLNWKLSVPLFVGTRAVEIPVEVQIDAVNGAPVYSFFSLELEMLMRQSAENIISGVVDDFSKQFVCLEVI